MPQVPLRFESELLKKIDKSAREKYETRSDFIRGAVIEKIKSETEKAKVRDMVLSRFAKGELSFEALKQFLGKEEADKYRIILHVFSKGKRAENIIRQLSK